jgi:predicted dehydrogenase
MWAPKIEQTEALKVELQYFLDCIEKDQTPFNDGRAGLRVVKLLEAARESLKLRGEIVSV